MREILKLDGSWQVIFDYENKGRTLNWQRRDNFYSYHDIEEVIVPACLEEFVQDYEGVAWYGKAFTVPSDWCGKVVRVQFEAVNYRAEVWVNGEAAGAHEGGYTGFELLIDDLLVEGENFIAVRVITPLITRDVVIDGLGRDDMPHWRGAIAGGIWQSVSMIGTGTVFVEDVFVTTDIESGEVGIICEFQNGGLTRQEIVVDWAIAPFGDEVTVVSDREVLTLNPGVSRHEAKLTVEDHKLWQLDDPRLYVLTTTVTSEGEQSDRVVTRFGFREFTAIGKQFYLNGEKIVLKTTFSEAFYPHSLAYPRDLELLRREFELVVEGNINMVRPWRKPQPRVVYDMADEMGVLFVGALPVECMKNWPQITPYTKQRIENEVVEMVRRDRNHPSIVIWEMFNEIIRNGLKRLKHSASLKARELDQTRMIIDEAGGFADGCSVYLPGSYEPITINDVHNYPGMPMEQGNYDGLLALGKTEEELEELGLNIGNFANSHVKPDLLTNISELGYGSIPDLEANFAQYKREGNRITPDYRMHERLHDSYLAVFRESGADRVFADFHAFVEACQEIHYTGNKLMAEACRINPDIAGIGIHALSDGDWVLGAGLVDTFRNPKRAYYAIKEVFADRYIAIRPSVQNVYSGQQVQVRLTSVNDGELLAGKLSLRVFAEDGRAVLAVEEGMDMPGGIVDLGVYDVDTTGLEGRCNVELTFAPVDAAPVENNSSFYALDEGKSRLPGSTFALIDMDGVLGDYLEGHGAGVEGFAEDTGLERWVLVNLNGWDGEVDGRFAKLGEWVARGGTAVFLNLPLAVLEGGQPEGNMYRRLTKGRILPFGLTLYSGKGLWTPCSHVVKEHDYYDGLPMNCLMGQEYRSVVSRWSIIEPVSEWICGNITYDWYAGLEHKQNYTGVTEAFHGADLTQIVHGDGAYILCTHRIVENLGKDPVADRLLRNFSLLP
jgi:beta-galactosidase